MSKEGDANRRRATAGYEDGGSRSTQGDGDEGIDVTIELVIGASQDSRSTAAVVTPSSRPRPEAQLPRMSWSGTMRRPSTKPPPQARFTTPPNMIESKPDRQLVVKLLQEQRYLDLLLLLKMALVHHPDDMELVRSVEILRRRLKRTGALSGGYHVAEPEADR